MELKIGREPKSRRLCVVKDGQPRLVGLPGSVPEDVSREHLSLLPDGPGKWKIKNLNEKNVTYVNGLAIESKVVVESDKLELGRSHYLLSWDYLKEPKVETVDIRPLRKIWREYDDFKTDSQIAERKFNVARSATGIITMLCVILGANGLKGTTYFILYGVAIILSLIFTLIAYKKSADIPLQQRDLNKQFQKRYVCPKCGHFMGFQDYDLLVGNEGCPHCKAKFVK